MTKHSIETDYLIIGGGAMGVSFADEIFTLDPTATITIVDRRETLGGHWNSAYPYVRLHQPAAFYGVNSKVLGKGNTDLSSKSEILAYYASLLEKYLASGRVAFLGKHEYLGDKRVAPLDSPDDVIEFKVNRRVVNATYMGVEVPATHPPKFEVDEGVPFVPLNELVDQYDKWEHFYVLGNGKTGIDAVVFLLNNQVPAGKIHWVISNDIWCFDRAHIQVGHGMGTLLKHGLLMLEVEKPSQVFEEMEKDGGIIRMDATVAPRKWKCATISQEELSLIRRVKNTIRKGRVKRLTIDEIEFGSERVAYPEGTLFVNCTADGLAQRPSKPLFSEGQIDLQSVFFCQQVFSAAIAAKLELSNLTDVKRNKIRPIPHPEFEEDWPRLFSMTIDNVLQLHYFFPRWMFNSRLNLLHHEPFLDYLKYAATAFRLAPKLREAADRFAV